MAKRRQGRPPLKRSESHCVTVSMRLLLSERQMFAEAAKKRGETLSAWIRASLYFVAESELEPGPCRK